MKVALIQDYFGDDIESNCTRMCRWISRAAADQARLVAFPECALSGYLGFGRNHLDDGMIEAIVSGIAKISACARKENVAVLFGSYTRRCGRWYNTALFFDKMGRQIASYDKLQLVDRDCYHVAPGMSTPPVINWDGVVVSFAICHDIRYPEVLRSASIRGSQLHFHLFFGARKATECSDQHVYDAHLCTRAVENGMFILAPNVSINEQMVRSQAVSSMGKTIAKASGWERQLVMVELPEKLGTGIWQMRRRGDLFPAATPAVSNSYFERAWWPTEDAMIDHSLAGLQLDITDQLTHAE